MVSSHVLPMIPSPKYQISLAIGGWWIKRPLYLYSKEGFGNIRVKEGMIRILFRMTSRHFLCLSLLSLAFTMYCTHSRIVVHHTHTFVRLFFSLSLKCVRDFSRFLCCFLFLLYFTSLSSFPSDRSALWCDMTHRCPLTCFGILLRFVSSFFPDSFACFASCVCWSFFLSVSVLSLWIFLFFRRLPFFWFPVYPVWRGEEFITVLAWAESIQSRLKETVLHGNPKERKGKERERPLRTRMNVQRTKMWILDDDMLVKVTQTCAA